MSYILDGFTVDELLKIGTVLVSLGVILAPILYPKFFSKKASKGVDTLTDWRIEFTQATGRTVNIGFVKEGEEGFNKVANGADFIFGIEGEPEQICVAKGHPEDLGEVTELGMEYGAAPNVVLYAKIKEGDPQILQWNPLDPKVAPDVKDLKRGIRIKGQEKSHYITMTLAVIWATLSVITVTSL